MSRNSHRFAAVAVATALSAWLAAGAAEVKIDAYEVQQSQAPADSTVLVRAFDSSEADLGKQKKKRQQETAQNMQTMAPIAFREALVQRLSEAGTYAEVRALDEGEVAPNSLVVEGRFTVLNPGNRAKRYWGGFGAGKAKVCVEGRVVDAEGVELATFSDCRSGTGMFSFAGGKAEGMMSNDVYKAAFNTAEFLSLWAKGQLPSTVKTKN
jgi:hypothetical protein